MPPVLTNGCSLGISCWQLTEGFSGAVFNAVIQNAVAIQCSLFNSQRAIFRMVALRAGSH